MSLPLPVIVPLPLPSLIHVIERLPTAVVLTDPAGFILVTSPSADVLLGERRDRAALHLDDHLALLTAPPRTTRSTSIHSDAGHHQLIGLLADEDHAMAPPDVATLAGEIAHEFNNLLGVIMNFAALASAGLPETSQTARDLDEVIAASKRAAAITHRLMDVSTARTMGDAPIM